MSNISQYQSRNNLQPPPRPPHTDFVSIRGEHDLKKVVVNLVVTMGDNHTPPQFPTVQSPRRFAGAMDAAGSSASQQRSSDIAKNADTLETILANDAASQELQRKHHRDSLSSAGSLVSNRSFNRAPGSGFVPASTATKPSPRPFGETKIVSHLRNSTSARQDIESALRAKGFANMDGGLSLGNAVIHASLLNPVAAAAAAAGNHYAAMMLQERLSRDVTMAQMTAAGNAAAFGLLPTPSSFLASRMGMANFGGNGIPNGGGGFGKVGMAMDPRFMQLAEAAGHVSTRIKRGPITMFMRCDSDSLSEYQCLIREQVELFEADKWEAASSVQGRNKQIVEGQVGIRCRHCAAVPPRSRQKGSMYFPTKLDRIYQAAQNLSAFHLCENCKHVPDDVRKKLLLLRERKSPAGGGKRYWGEGVRCLGVVENGSGLRFR